MDHKSVEQGATELSTFWRELKASMEVLRSDLKATNERLRRKVTQLLNERRQKLLELQGMSSALGSRMARS